MIITYIVHRIRPQYMGAADIELARSFLDSIF